MGAGGGTEVRERARAARACKGLGPEPWRSEEPQVIGERAALLRRSRKDMALCSRLAWNLRRSPLSAHGSLWERTERSTACIRGQIGLEANPSNTRACARKGLSAGYVPNYWSGCGLTAPVRSSERRGVRVSLTHFADRLLALVDTFWALLRAWHCARRSTYCFPFPQLF